MTDSGGVLKALGDRSRLLIMNALMDGPSYVEVLAERLKLSPSTVSFHLKKLRGAKLIETTKREPRKGGKRKIRTYSAKDADGLASLLITYKTSFLDDAVDRFVELWSEI